MSNQANLQNLIWDWADPWGWRIYMAVCILMSLFLFRTLLREARQKDRIGLDAQLIGRLIWLSAGFAGIFVRLNSACEFLSPFLFGIGGVWMAFLIDSGWCYRLGSFRQRLAGTLADWWHDLRGTAKERHSASD